MNNDILRENRENRENRKNILNLLDQIHLDNAQFGGGKKRSNKETHDTILKLNGVLNYFLMLYQHSMNTNNILSKQLKDTHQLYLNTRNNLISPNLYSPNNTYTCKYDYINANGFCNDYGFGDDSIYYISQNNKFIYSCAFVK